MMTTAILLLLLAATLGVAALVLKALRVRARLWAREMTDIGLPFVHVTTRPVADDGESQVIELTLRGTSRPHRLQRFSASRAEVRNTGLQPPDGFAAADQQDDPDPQDLVWTPVTPVLLEPAAPRPFVFRFDRFASKPAIVGVRVETPMRVGGGLLLFSVRVPLRDPRALEAVNLRATLTTRARELGVPGNTLPEWPGLQELEREVWQSNPE
jgi:hypothetical protein